MPNRESPTFTQIRETLKRALYDPDPFERASAAADLTLWQLPVTPMALITAAERITGHEAVFA